MIPRWTSALTGSTVYEADARAVAATLPDGCASLAILDGPYGNMVRADWDRIPRGGTLLDLYRGHFDDVGRLCAPSASLYIWNTSEGWAGLHPDLVARGWVFRSLLIWHKTVSAAFKSAHEEGARTWPEVMEVCGFYQREAWAPSTCAGQEIGYAAGRDERNWIRPWMLSEWTSAGLKMRDADKALGTNGMAGHYFQPSQWSLPTWEAYQRLAAYAAQHGPDRGDLPPYFVLESIWRSGGDLRASYDHLRAEYDHLRAEYEASRPPFTCPFGVGNVWTAPTVAGAERLRDPSGETLHPCQKPLLFADRMIRASSRPGSTIWAPYGGTLRELVAAERMARGDLAEARRVITCELNQDDGKDYIGPAIRQAEGLSATVSQQQVGLFGARS